MKRVFGAIPVAEVVGEELLDLRNLGDWTSKEKRHNGQRCDF